MTVHRYFLSYQMKPERICQEEWKKLLKSRRENIIETYSRRHKAKRTSTVTKCEYCYVITSLKIQNNMYNAIKCVKCVLRRPKYFMKLL